MKKIITTKSLNPLFKRLGTFLSKEDIEIFFVQSEEDIIKTHSIENADLIIMEIAETEDNIDKTCSIIRNDDALNKASIILISETDKSVISRCYACKANDYITKPVNPEELLRKIFKFLYPVKRNHVRVQLQVLIKGESDRDYFFANSIDISSSGILIESDRVFGKRERVKCSFFLESNQIKTSGEIVRTAEKEPDLYDYGLKFINPDSKTKEIIERFIEKSTKNLKSVNVLPINSLQ
jgi:CheY-like chemotaxis protein